MGVYGTRLYGKVDRLPGVGFVATKFYHANHLPLVPVGTFAVLDGSDEDVGFSGRPVRLSLRSILLGYFRGWTAGAALVCGLAGLEFALIVLSGVDGMKPPKPLWPFVTPFLVMGPLFLVFLYGSTTWWLSAWLMFLGFSGGFLHRYGLPLLAGAGAPRDVQIACIALLASNAGFLFYSLARPGAPAREGRARAVGESVGAPPEIVEAALRGEKVRWRRCLETGAILWTVGEWADRAKPEPCAQPSEVVV